VGRTESELQADWGAPTSSKEVLPSGKSLSYSGSSLDIERINVAFNGHSWRADHADDPSEIIFVLDENGIVIDFRWEFDQEESSINWYAIGHTVVIVGLIALFVYITHLMPNPDGDWVG